MSFSDCLINESNTWCDIFVHNINCNSITAATGVDSGATAAFSVGWTGPWAAGILGYVYASRVGNIVTLNVEGVSGAGATGNSITCDVGALGDFAPLSNKVFPYSVLSNATQQTGLFEVYANGSMSFFADATGAAFAATGTDRFFTGSVTYNLVG